MELTTDSLTGRMKPELECCKVSGGVWDCRLLCCVKVCLVFRFSSFADLLWGGQRGEEVRKVESEMDVFFL